MAWMLSCVATMESVSRPLPLRWVYPIVGAVIAGGATAVLYAVKAQPLYIAVVATLACIIAGRLLGQKGDSLRETAATDPLTAVANRRHFDQKLASSVAQATRTGSPLTLLFVDVDHLKTINDQLGHAAGDAALRLVGESLARTCRSRDIVARWGGDEFAVLAQWTTAREGLILAQRIRETLARLARQYGTAPVPTVSIGVAELAQLGLARPEALLHAADDALYLAKTAGRDRVTVASTDRKRRRRKRQSLANMKTRPIRRIEDQEPAPTRH
jgi:diguanylate cyclase (GGDEF)-like protein